MATYRDFYKYIHMDMHNAPRFTVESATKAVVIEFLERTKIWEETADPISVLQNTYLHDITYSTSLPYKYVSITRAWLADNEAPIVFTSEDQLYMELGTNWPNTTSTQITHVVSQYNDQIGVYPLANTTSHSDLYIRGPITLTRAATEIPDWLFDTYVEVIGLGIKAKVLGQFNKAWSAPSWAKQFTIQYNRKLRAIRAQTIRGKGELSTSIKPQSFKYIFGQRG